MQYRLGLLRLHSLELFSEREGAIVGILGVKLPQNAYNRGPRWQFREGSSRWCEWWSDGLKRSGPGNGEDQSRSTDNKKNLLDQHVPINRHNGPEKEETNFPHGHVNTRRDNAVTKPLSIKLCSPPLFWRELFSGGSSYLGTAEMRSKLFQNFVGIVEFFDLLA